MNAAVYIKCLDSQNYPTGNVLGVYDFGSGSGDTNVVFNLLYPTGAHYVGSNINASVYPLASMDTDVSNYNFTGDHAYRLGYENTLPEWAVLFNLNNGRYCDTGYQKMMLFNTFTSGNGFGLYLNELHRLQLILSQGIGAGKDYKVYSMPDEIPQKSLVYLNYVSGDNISFGYYDLGSESIIGGIVDMEGVGFTPNASPNYVAGVNETIGVKTTSLYSKIASVPFSGSIYDFVFISGGLSENESDICFKCLFATGINETSSTGYYAIPEITGYGYETVKETQITGYQTGNVVTLGNSNNVTFSVATASTGGVVYADRLVPLTGDSLTSGKLETYTKTPLYDMSAISQRTSVNIDFRSSLLSGDAVVIYTYNAVNPYVNNTVQNLYADLKDGLEYQLWGNGLLETINVDYTIESDEIKNFTTDDALQNDYTINKSVVTDYSGLWESGRIWLNSGSGGGKVYYPSASQYDEDGQIIYLTGIASVCVNNPNVPKFGYDLYLNGQRLITGLHYTVHESGSYPFTLMPGPTYPNFIVSLSGNNLPHFTADVTYLMNGDVDTISDEQSSELVFYPVENNPLSRTYLIVTGTSQITGVTGYSPQIWVNGVRQHKNIDYRLVRTCELTSGFDNDYGNLDFIIFNNVDDIFGLE